MWQVFLTSEAEKGIKKLPQNIQERVKDMLREIAKNPLAGKFLKGSLAGRFSARVGDYRIVSHKKNEKNEIWILYVRHRKDAYK